MGAQPCRTKVAVLIPTLERGGAEQDVVRNFPRLNREEFEVVVALFGYPGPLAAELERQGVRYVARGSGPRDTGIPSQVVDFESLPALRRLAVRLRWLAYVIRVTLWVGGVFARERIDIAHFFLPHSYAYGMLGCALRRRRAKTVMSRLSLNFYKDEQRKLAWMERHVFHPRLDIAIGNSRLILDELAAEGVPRERLRLLYNGIDLAPFAAAASKRSGARAALGVGDDAFVMVAVGNLWSHKGHGDLIEACALVKDDLPEGWQLLIAGRDQDDNRAAYERLIEDRGLARHVQLLGEWADIPGLLVAADVFVQPSRHEGLPNAIVEAMAAGLPVVATAVGGIPEVVTISSIDGDRSRETGWLVAPLDPGSLGQALLEAAHDPVRRQAMVVRAQARARADFSVERSVRDYEAIYRELAR